MRRQLLHGQAPRPKVAHVRSADCQSRNSRECPAPKAGLLEKVKDPVGKRLEVRRIARPVENDVRPVPLRSDEPLMHRFNGRRKLFPDRGGSASSRMLIAGKTPFQACRRRAIKEDAEIEQLSQRQPAQKPQTLNKNHWFGGEPRLRGFAAVCGEVVSGRQGPPPGPQVLHCSFQRLPINGHGVIEVQPLSAMGRQVRTIPVEVVLAYKGCPWTEGLLQLVCEPALARATPSHDGNEHRAGRVSRQRWLTGSVSAREPPTARPAEAPSSGPRWRAGSPRCGFRRSASGIFRADVSSPWTR